jgi:hypothetical protein
MSRIYLMIPILCGLTISACAGAPETEDVSSLRPGWLECPRMAPMGSKIKSKVVCGQNNRRRKISPREEHEVYRETRDVIKSGRMPGGL